MGGASRDDPVEGIVGDLAAKANERLGGALGQDGAALGVGRLRGASLFRPTSDGLDYTIAGVAAVPSVTLDEGHQSARETSERQVRPSPLPP